MKKFTLEMKVGIFFVLVFVLIAWISTQLGDYEFKSKYGLKLSAIFRSSAGISEDTAVNLAGIKIGVVTGKSLDRGQSRILFQVLTDTLIPEDSRISIHTYGFLGQKYLEIVPGSSRNYLQSGDEFVNVEDSGDFTELTATMNDVADDVRAVTESLRAVLGGEEGEEQIRGIFTSLNTITTVVADTLEANEEKMDKIMDYIEALTAQMVLITKENRESFRDAMKTMPAIAENLSRISGNLADIMESNNEDISLTLANLVGVTENLSKSLEAISNIAQKIDDGQGTIGKLVNDDETIANINDAVEGINDYLERVRKLQVEVSYRGEYHIEQEQGKSYFNLNIRPTFDKVYMVGLVDDPVGRKRHTLTETKTTTNPGAADEDVTEEIEEKDVTTSELLFTAQIGKRWHNFLFRGGIIESHGGAGVEFFMWEDRINFAFEVFDFDTTNNPHLKTWLNISFLDHFFITGGVDDFINKYDDPRYFIGGGLYFTDRDISILATQVPSGITGM